MKLKNKIIIIFSSIFLIISLTIIIFLNLKEGESNKEAAPEQSTEKEEASEEHDGRAEHDEHEEHDLFELLEKSPESDEVGSFWNGSQFLDHDHDHDDNTASFLQTKEYANLSFGDYYTMGEDVFNSSEYKTIIASFKNFIVFKDSYNRIYLFNTDTEENEIISYNSDSHKRISDNGLVFSAQTAKNESTLFYLDLNFDNPEAYEFYTINNTLFSNDYGLTDKYFYISYPDNSYLFFEYNIDDKYLDLNLANPNTIFSDSIFTDGEEIYGYNSDSPVQYIFSDIDNVKKYKTEFTTFTKDNTKYYAIGKNRDRISNNIFYIGGLNADSEFGHVFYKNQALESLSGQHTYWLDSRFIIDMSQFREVLLYDTVNNTYVTLLDSVDTLFVDKSTKTIYFNNYYLSGIMALKYDFK